MKYFTHIKEHQPREVPMTRTIAFILMALLSGSGVGCSINKIAVNKIGNALAKGGDTYASDDNPELVKEFTRFVSVSMEGLDWGQRETS